jgi:hypothetical protein
VAIQSHVDLHTHLAGRSPLVERLGFEALIAQLRRAVGVAKEIRVWVPSRTSWTIFD